MPEAPIPFDNTYARLPARFFSRTNPTPVASPRLIKLNTGLARTLGIDALTPEQAAEIFSGNSIAPGSEPLAEAYAGHQFGNFVPQLGDGRANLLGEVIALNGLRYDIQLKGSGRTPFSRGGDGRAALGPVLREYIVSEAMAALGVPTTRALAAVTTGERVFREAALPGAIFTRVATSHIRVGTFQYFAVRGDIEALRILADYTIARHYPEATQSPRPYRALFEAILRNQAALIAQWMSFGFIHGVMNTDNTSISGETIDYGPCAFMEAYIPSKVFSSIDMQGRYAYNNQPHAAHWNLTCLAQALVPLLIEEEGAEEAAITSAKEALATFEPLFQATRLNTLRRKLGLSTEHPEDAALIQDLLDRMAANAADFTLTFRRLCDATSDNTAPRTLFTDPTAYDTWAKQWHQRLTKETQDPTALMRAANPTYIPRNHIVEAALNAAMYQQDFQPFEQLLEVVTHPYEDRPNTDYFTTPALPNECILETFCGT